MTVYIYFSDAHKLETEALTQSKLRHAHTTQLYGLVWEPDAYAVVMQYVRYGSLDSFLAKYHTPTVCKLKMAHEIVLGMNYLHTQSPPIIHRDLKIQNVLVSESIRMMVGCLQMTSNEIAWF